MLTLYATTQYRKDRNLCKKRGLRMRRLDDVVQTLLEQKPLAPRHRDHELTGNWTGFRECHIQPNWLLIYYVDGGKLVLTAARTGTHSDLFKK